MDKTSAIEYLGLAAGVYLAYRLSSAVMGFVYAKFLASPLNVSRLGEWAVVTGSTDGIGKAYAMALAKKGLNVVLVSRSPHKLQTVASEIESKYKVKTKIVDIDFTSDDREYVPKLEKEIQGLDIGVLVNNVGMSYEYPEEFLTIENGADLARKLVSVNVNSVNAVTRAVLPGMVDRKKGAVINVSSMTCMFPSPLFTVYAATKAYVDNFTSNLSLEYGRKGVTVQCVLPGYVVSKMSKLRKPSVMAPTPEAFVKSALGRLGVEARTTGYWAHTLMEQVINSLPTFLANKILYDQISTIRIKAIKKKAKEAKEE